jgi:hypothetical protein
MPSMKLDSKYFDSIRIQPRRGRSQSAKAEPVAMGECQWKGCQRKGTHLAPKGRDKEGEYYRFCRDHVAAYNKSYNYFQGMSDHEITDFQKDATTGHRPTWTMGVNKPESDNPSSAAGPTPFAAADPLEILRNIRRRGRAPEPQTPARRILHRAARNHLAALNLDENATPEEIRTQFKALAKLYHPDHNGGDRSSEERFREILDAYNYLKQAGLC